MPEPPPRSPLKCMARTLYILTVRRGRPQSLAIVRKAAHFHERRWPIRWARLLSVLREPGARGVLRPSPRQRLAALRESRREGDHQRAPLVLAPRVRASSPPAAPICPPWICSPALFPAPVPAPPLPEVPPRLPSDSPHVTASLALNTASPSAAPLPGFPAPKAGLSLRQLHTAKRVSFRLEMLRKVAEPDIFK